MLDAVPAPKLTRHSHDMDVFGKRAEKRSCDTSKETFLPCTTIAPTGGREPTQHRRKQALGAVGGDSPFCADRVTQTQELVSVFDEQKLEKQITKTEARQLRPKNN